MNAHRWPFWKSILALVILELIYIGITRWLVGLGDPNDTSIEWLRTALRLASAAVVWLLFRSVLIKPDKPQKILSTPWSGLLILAMICDFIPPILSGNLNLPTQETRFIFAITAIPVGIREELVYRGVLQTLLEKKFGLGWAIAITAAAFSVLHLGVQPWTFFTVSLYISTAVIYGLIYAKTRQLWIVIVMHSIFDAIFCYTPIIDHPWEPQRTLPFLAAACLLTLAWFIFWRKKESA